MLVLRYQIAATASPLIEHGLHGTAHTLAHNSVAYILSTYLLPTVFNLEGDHPNRASPRRMYMPRRVPVLLLSLAVEMCF